MKNILHASANRLGCYPRLCLLVVLCGIGVSDGRFLDLRDARTMPRGRTGCRPCSKITTQFLEPGHLGRHGYSSAGSEKNGVVYTCEGGFIDIAHVRGAIDRTAFIAAKIFDALKRGETEFSFKLTEPSTYFIQLVPPQDREDLSWKDREGIARDISIRLGQYFAFTACTWHEILTWFGYKSVGFYPEFHSSFSCEDTFSDLLGSSIGAAVLRDGEHEFDEGVTLALDRELEKLGVQTRNTAMGATKSVKGRWFSGGLLFVDTKRRNFDIGLEDGFVTPWIVPDLSVCEGERARSYPIPNPDFLCEYGFSLKFEIEPREWEKGKILRIVYPDVKERRQRLEPAIHFALIMDYIKKDAAGRYGRQVGTP